jgi:hypothetical protein
MPKEPVSLSFNKTAFSLKNEECIRESLAKNLPASLVVVKYKQKDIITGIITLLNNYFEVQGPIPSTAAPNNKDLSP